MSRRTPALPPTDVATPAAAASVPAPASGIAPGRTRQVANFVVFQAAWLSAVLGAAHGHPLAGTAAIVAAMAWHVGVSVRPREEAALLGIVCAIGFVVETESALQGHVAYPSGQPDPDLPPYWMVALWGLFGIALNVTLRWLKHRPGLAFVLGAVAGPLSFVSGVRLGGARFIDAPQALVTLACTWAVLMPVLMALSNRFDGVALPDPAVPSPVRSPSPDA